MKPVIKVQVPRSISEEFDIRYKEKNWLLGMIRWAILHHIAILEKDPSSGSYKLVDYCADVETQIVEDQ